MPNPTYRPPRRFLPRRMGERVHASRVSASISSAEYFPSLNSSSPTAYVVRPERSVCGRRRRSRHFWTAEGLIPKRFPTFVSPIWSIALATVLMLPASLHRKCKLTIDRECKSGAAHSRHGNASSRHVLGQARRSQSGRWIAVRAVGYRPGTRHLAVCRKEMAGRNCHAGREEPFFPGNQSRREYGVAQNRPWG